MDERYLEIYYQINRDAAIEMSYKPRQSYIARCRELNLNPPKIFYDPKIRSLHPWLARRPRSIARFSTTLALDPHASVFKPEEIYKKVNEGYPPLISYTKPNQVNKKLILCDPMAGGGTIPLESVLLGIETIAFDFNPISYLILKATVEYPQKFKGKLKKAVKEEAKRMIKFAQTVLGNFYDKSDDAYIYTKSIECMSCRKSLKIAPEAGIERREGIIVKRTAKTLRIRCTSCGNQFEVNKQEFLREWVKRQKNLMSTIFSGKLNYNLLLSTHPILIKKNTTRDYIVANERDYKLLMNAYEFLVKNINELKKYIPTGRIPKQNKVFAPLLDIGLEYWYEIFNPRQLLALAVLTRYVRERSQELIERDGEFGAAVTVYLSFGLSKMIDFNTILTTWNTTNRSIRDTVGQYARSRKVGLNLEYCEAVVPYKNLPWVFEPDAMNRTGGGICPVVEELCKKMEGVNTNIKVFQFDAKKINLLNKKIDIINVDPPYFDQHIYSDLSEFFWMLARISLKNLIGSYLFNEEINGKKSWKYINWNPRSPYVPKKDELIVRKENYAEEVRKYKINMTEFFRNAYKALKDDGKLVLWFTHKSWKAWETILYSLYVSNFKVEGFYPFVSEHPTRSVSMQGEPKLNRTIVIIASKQANEIKNIEDDVFHFCSKVYEYLNHAKIMPKEKIELWEKAITLMAASTARLTAMDFEDRELAFQKEILPKGIVFGLTSLLKLLGNGKEIESLSTQDKANLLLHVLQKLYGKVRIDLVRHICNFYNTSFTFTQNGKVKMKSLDRDLSSILETLVMKK